MSPAPENSRATAPLGNMRKRSGTRSLARFADGRVWTQYIAKPKISVNEAPEVGPMKPTKSLHNLGQSIWLDNITRDLLDSGTLKRYIGDLSVTGLTSNPTIFDHAIAHSKSYDPEIRRLVGTGLSGEGLFFELAGADLTPSADLFAPFNDLTAGG